MEVMKMQFQFGSIQSIYNKALDIARIASCAVSLSLMGKLFA
ncbi:hypothetical protein VPHF99_0027 [Vibrio phage F99]|nr:hypothetical protein MYOV056v2_p0025 [Vibrio phage 184E37.3a]